MSEQNISLNDILNKNLKSYYFSQFALYAYDDQKENFAKTPNIYSIDNLNQNKLSFEIYAAVSDKSYKYNEAKLPDSIVNSGNEAIFYESKDGFQCNIYIDSINNEIMIAFTGTEAETNQDVITDASAGITQWYNNSAKVLKMIEEAKKELIKVNSEYESNTTINFTGHSLGGALAQMAAYDYVYANPKHADINLQTFNGLGADYSMEKVIDLRNKQNETSIIYDKNLLNKENIESIHYRENTDPVSILFPHIGGELVILSDGVLRDPGTSHSQKDTIVPLLKGLVDQDNGIILDNTVETAIFPLNNYSHLGQTYTSYEGETFSYLNIRELVSTAEISGLSFRLGDLTNYYSDSSLNIFNLVDVLGDLIHIISKSDNFEVIFNELEHVINVASEYANLFSETNVFESLQNTLPLIKAVIHSLGVDDVAFYAMSSFFVYNALYPTTSTETVVNEKINDIFNELYSDIDHIFDSNILEFKGNDNYIISFFENTRDKELLINNDIFLNSKLQIENYINKLINLEVSLKDVFNKFLIKNLDDKLTVSETDFKLFDITNFSSDTFSETEYRQLYIDLNNKIADSEINSFRQEVKNEIFKDVNDYFILKNDLFLNIKKNLLNGSEYLTNSNLIEYTLEADDINSFLYENNIKYKTIVDYLIDTRGIYKENINKIEPSINEVFDLYNNQFELLKNTVYDSKIILDSETILENQSINQISEILLVSNSILKNLEEGNDLILGNDTNNHVYGGKGNDTFHMKKGTDIIGGEEGSDSYYIEKGEGTKIIYEKDNSVLFEDIDKIYLDTDKTLIFSSENISLGDYNNGNINDLIIQYSDNIDDVIILKNYWSSKAQQVEKIILKNDLDTEGNHLELNIKEIADFSLKQEGSEFSDHLVALNNNDNLLSEYHFNELDGKEGSDKLIGSNHNDILIAGDDNDIDILFGKEGNDILVSGGYFNHLYDNIEYGTDFLYGGEGNDQYLIQGERKVIIRDFDFEGNDYDKIIFSKDYDTNPIFEKENDNLIIKHNLNNLENIIIIENWFSNSFHKIEEIRYNNGKTFTLEEIESMIIKHDKLDLDLKDINTNIDNVDNLSNIRRVDPFVLDLDNNGIQTLDLSYSIHFDHANNGIKENTGWITSSDAFLTLDLNGNGLIDSGLELFGNNTAISFDINGNPTGFASNGFEALSYLDSNGDGVIDSSDTDFANLRLWQDFNYNGISEDYELSTLFSYAIESISLNGVQVNIDQGNGNIISFTGSATLTNGDSIGTGSLDLAFDTENIEYVDKIAIDPELAHMSNIEGTGFLRTILEAASLNDNLKILLLNFESTTSRDKRVELIDSIIIEWVKTSEFSDFYKRSQEALINDPTLNLPNFGYQNNQINSNFDKLAVAEVFSGEELRTADSTTFTADINWTDINNFYNDLKVFMYSSMIDNSNMEIYKDAFNYSNINNIVNYNTEALKLAFDNTFNSNIEQAISDLHDFTYLYKDKLEKTSFNSSNYLFEKIQDLPLTSEIIQQIENSRFTTYIRNNTTNRKFKIYHLHQK